MFGPKGPKNVFIGGEGDNKYEYESVGLEPDWNNQDRDVIYDSHTNKNGDMVIECDPSKEFRFQDYLEGKKEMTIEIDETDAWVDEDGEVHEKSDVLECITRMVEYAQSNREKYLKEQADNQEKTSTLSFTEQLRLEAQKIREEDAREKEEARRKMEAEMEGLSFTERLKMEAKLLENEDDDEPDIIMDHGVEIKDESTQAKIERGEKVKPCLAAIRKRFNFPKAMVEKLEQTYSCVYVHDYGDEYHLTEEERKKKFRFYEAQELVMKNRKIYNRLPDYIEAMRRVMAAVDIIAEANSMRISNYEKFRHKVLAGKIKISGINFPKYRGKDRKRLDGKFISEWILDPDKDIAELMEYYETPKSVISLEDEENGATAFEKLMGPGVYEWLNANPVTDDDPFAYAAVVKKKSKMNKIIDSKPEFKMAFKQLAHAERRKQSTMEQYAFYTTREEFESVSKHDAELGYNTKSHMPKFKGDIRNDKDYKAYMEELDAWEYENTYVKYNGRNIPIDDYNHMRFKDIAERNGWNVLLLMKNEGGDSKEDGMFLKRKDKIQIRYSKFIMVKSNAKARRQTKNKLITDDNRKRADILEYVIRSVDEENRYKVSKKDRYKGLEEIVVAVAEEDRALGKKNSKYIKLAKSYGKKVKPFDPVKFMDKKKNPKKDNKNGINTKKRKSKEEKKKKAKDNIINGLIPDGYRSWDDYESAMLNCTFQTKDMRIKRAAEEKEKKKEKKRLNKLPKKAREKLLADE